MSAPGPPPYASGDMKQPPPGAEMQQPYPPAPQPQYYPPPQPQPQPMAAQPMPQQQYPPPPGAYYQPQPVGTTVIVNTDPMMGATLFPPDPMQMTCPNCHQSILTRTQYELGMLVWLVAAMLCIVGLILCAWIPCLIDSLKDVVHTCPSCGAMLGRHNRMGGMGGYGRGNRYRY